MKSKNLFNILLHSIAYDVAWLCAILSAQTKPIWIGPAIVLGISAIQVLWQKLVMRKTDGLCTMIIAFMVCGFIFDTLSINLGIIVFSNPLHPMVTSPFMLVIWCNFAILFYTSLMFLASRYLVLAGLSFVGFPLAYYCGAYFHAAEITQGWLSLLIIGFIYAFAIPSTLYLYHIRTKAYA